MTTLIINPAAVSLAVSAAIKALTNASKAGATLSDTVRKGFDESGVGFANAFCDAVRGADLPGEKGMREKGTGTGSAFSRWTLAVRVLKECAPDGMVLKVSAKSGESTACTVETAPVKAEKQAKGASGAGVPADASGADAGAGGGDGNIRAANHAESIANMVAGAGDVAILEAFELLAVKDKSALTRLIAAGLAYATKHGLSDAVAAQVPGMGELLAA